MNRFAGPLLIAATILLGACETFEEFPVPTCPLEPTLSSSEATPGDELLLTDMYQTYRQDSVVLVGGVEAPVTEVLRENCDDCDTCVEEVAQCAFVRCECEQCDDTCSTCEESLSFLVPELPDGSWEVVAVNSIGTSVPVWLTITGSSVMPPDTGDTGGDSGDTGGDTGDTGSDTDPADTSAADTSTSPVDTGETASSTP